MRLFDLHNDLPTSDLSLSEETARYSRAGVTAVLAVWTTLLGRLPAFPRIRGFRYAVEDMDFFDFSDECASAVRALKPLYCGLTWNNDNSKGGGAFGSVGLTDAGRRTIDFLAENGIAVDGAHLSKRSFDEASERADRFIVSHTFVSDLNPHPRNISIGAIKRVALKGGIVGFSPIRAFTGGGEDEYKYIEGLLRAVDACGEDVVAIGTDFNGSTDFPSSLGGYDKFGALAEKLTKAGLGARTVEKIFYGNAARFFAAGGTQ